MLHNMSSHEEIDGYDDKKDSFDAGTHVLSVEQQQRILQRDWEKVRRRIGIQLAVAASLSYRWNVARSTHHALALFDVSCYAYRCQQRCKCRNYEHRTGT